MSTNQALMSVFERIGRPNPCSFYDVIRNSFFEGGHCPSLTAMLTGVDGVEPTMEPTSHGGVTYGVCTMNALSLSESNPEVGFQLPDGGCSRPSLMASNDTGITSSNGTGDLSVYALDATIGLPAAWENHLSSYKLFEFNRPTVSHGELVDDEVPSAVGELPSIRAKFFSCDLESNIEPSELEIRIKAQMSIMQQAHDGRLQCAGKSTYRRAAAQTGVHFLPFNRSTDLVYVRNEPLCNDCEMHYEDLFTRYLTIESGTMNVMLCRAQTMLGFSQFPWQWTQQGYGGVWVDYTTLPGGGDDQYSLGRTLVHESSHYLGLLHTFENECRGNGDGVPDTNFEQIPFFGCPTETRHTCDPTADPVNNFMDYADDACMCDFTPMQGARLRNHIRHYMVEQPLL
jgi:hypothetical protein